MHKSHYYVHRTSWVTIGGTTYKPDNIIVADSSGPMPIFGKIEYILFINDEWQFVLQLLDTHTYNTHYHAYEVSHYPSHTPIIICKQSSFVDYHVLALYHNTSSLTFVPLKYHIPEYY